MDNDATREESRDQLAQGGESAVPVLLMAYRNSESSKGKEAAIEALKQLKAEVTPFVLDSLRHPEGKQRERAAKLVGDLELTDDAVLSGLVELLRNSESSVRYQAEWSLVTLGKEAVGTLRKVLKNGDVESRRGAAAVLFRIGEEANGAKEELFCALEDSDSVVQENSANALNKIIDSTDLASLPRLIDALGNDKISYQVKVMIRDIGPSCVPQLVKALQNPDPKTRMHTIEIIGRFGPQEGVDMSDLIKALDDESSEVRAAAAEAIGKLHIHSPDAITALTKILSDPFARVRSNSAYALRWIGEEAASAVPQLAILAESDPDNRIRLKAIDALGAIAKNHHTAIPVLCTVLEATDAEIRSAAALALNSYAKAIRESLASANRNSIGFITASSGYEKSVIKMLSSLMGSLHDEDATVRKYSAFAIGEIEDLQLGNEVKDLVSRARQQLLYALDDSNAYVRRASIHSLARLGTPDSRTENAFLELLKKAEYERFEKRLVRYEAAFSLAKYGRHHDRILPVLREALNTSDDEARRRAAFYLGCLGPDAIAAVPDLSKVLADDNEEEVRNAAANALKKIDPESTAMDEAD